MKIPDMLLSDITGYCKANNLVLDDYLISALRQGHTVLKYGSTPRVTIPPVKVVEEPAEEAIEEVPLPVPEVVIPIKEIKTNTEDIYQED